MHFFLLLHMQNYNVIITLQEIMRGKIQETDLIKALEYLKANL